MDNIIFRNWSHPRETSGVCTGLFIDMFVTLRIVDVVADTLTKMSVVTIPGVTIALLSNIEIIVVTAALVGVEFVVKNTYADVVEMLPPVPADTINGGALNLGAEVSARGLLAVITIFDFTKPTPLGGSFLSCRARLSS